ARSLPHLLPALLHCVDDHDGAMETNRGVLATVRDSVRGIFITAMARRISSVSHASAARSFGGAKTISGSRGSAGGDDTRKRLARNTTNHRCVRCGLGVERVSLF